MLIPYPNKEELRKNKRRKQKRRKNKKRKNRRKNKLFFPKEWDNYHPNSAKAKHSDVCGRRKLVVNFADIGWGDWIISPKSFEAHLCAGTCPFPLMKVSLVLYWYGFVCKTCTSKIKKSLKIPKV
jgi:hypothetical protein